MGEAIYYFKAVFENESQAKASLSKFIEYLKLNKKAYDYWQDHRSNDNVGRLKAKFDELGRFIEGWDGFEEDNDFASWFIEAEDLSTLEVRGNAVLFSQEVWHFDDWTQICNFAESIGAIGSGWVSDEYAEPDYYDLIVVSRHRQNKIDIDAKLVSE